MNNREKGVGFLFVIVATYFVVAILIKYLPNNYNQGQQSTIGSVSVPLQIETATATQTSQTLEVGQGQTANIQITIGNQSFTVAAVNTLYPIFGMSPSVGLSFNDAANVAHENAGLYTVNVIQLQYQGGEPVYTIHGTAKDKFQGFDVDNSRSVSIQAQTGAVLSVEKESLVISFFKSLIMNTVRSWAK